jgi:hypothetical protein
MDKDLTVKFKYSSDEEFKRLLIKLYAGQLMTSNSAAKMLRIDKESFLSEVRRYQVAVNCLDTDEVVSKMQRENDKKISKVLEIVSRAKMMNQGKSPHFWGRPDMINMIQQIIEVV